MKTLSITITVFLLAGALFFSCDLADPYADGTLVIQGINIADVNNFRVVCRNGDNEVTENFKNGEKTSISLSPGAWSVAITALNKEEGIAYGGKDVSIAAGKVSTLKVNLYFWSFFKSFFKENNEKYFRIINFKIPEGLEAVYVTDDPTEDISVKENIQNYYGLRGFKTVDTFKKFFAVVFKCNNVDRDAIYTSLISYINTLLSPTTPLHDNDGGKQYGRPDLGESTIDLYKSENNNYIIIAFRLY